MPVYVSTGGFNSQSIIKSVDYFLKNKIFDIELSGGIYEPYLLKKLLRYKNYVNFQVHNYFPPPKFPFVLNVCSLNKEIEEKSLNHIYNSLNFCSKINSDHYSFHAGFLCDFQIKELGRVIKKKKLYEREKCLELFIKNVVKIFNRAESLGIKIMIENNVLSQKNHKEFNGNPFIMCDITETLNIFNIIPKKIRLLLDVGHLKVTSVSLKFNLNKAIKKLNPLVGGYHLSDNNGIFDTNYDFDQNSWFYNKLKKKLDYYSIEVYKFKIKNLYKLKKKLEKDLIK